MTVSAVTTWRAGIAQLAERHPREVKTPVQFVAPGTTFGPRKGAFLFQAQKSAPVDLLLCEKHITMFLPCKSNVRTMPKKAISTQTHSFTVTLPAQAVSMLDRLIAVGLHGSSRAEVARALILSRLEQLSGPVLAQNQEPAKPSRP